MPAPALSKLPRIFRTKFGKVIPGGELTLYNRDAETGEALDEATAYKDAEGTQPITEWPVQSGVEGSWEVYAAPGSSYTSYAPEDAVDPWEEWSPPPPDAPSQAGDNTFTGTNIYEGSAIFVDGPFTDVTSFEGVVGDGVNDDTDGLAQAHAAGVPLIYPDGKTFLTSEGIVQGAQSVRVGQGTTVKATAAMGALWKVGDDVNYPRAKNLIGKAAVLDCNDLATIGLQIYKYRRFRASGFTVNKTALDGIVVGDAANLSSTGYKAILDDLHTTRGTTDEVPVGGHGLRVYGWATDGEYSNMELVGNDIGVRVDANQSRFSHIHPWGYENHLPSICFKDTSDGNTWTDCMADSPSQYCWLLTSTGTRIIGGTAYLNAFVTPNTVDVIYATEALPAFTVLGLRMHTNAATTFKRDFANTANTGISSCTVLGIRKTAGCVTSENLNVASAFGGRLRLFTGGQIRADDGAALSVATAAALVYFNVNTVNGQIAAVNGADLLGYSGAFASEKWRILGATGAFKPGRYATADLPSAATAGLGAVLFDTTRGKLVTSDGAAWQVDDDKVDVAGDTMTGPLVLAADPANPMEAATRQYVLAVRDALIAGAPGTLDTLNEIAATLSSDESTAAALAATVAGKLDVGAYITRVPWRGGAISDAGGAGTRILLPNSTSFPLFGGNVSPNGIFYFDPARYASTGKTLKLDLLAQLFTNVNAPAATFTFGLYPVTAVGGIADQNSITTLGAVIAGSTIAFAAPAANTPGHGESGDFAAPAAGFYAIGLVQSAGITADAAVICLGQVESRLV